MASYLYHTAQPHTFAVFPPWRISRSWSYKTCRRKGKLLAFKDKFFLEPSFSPEIEEHTHWNNEHKKTGNPKSILIM